MFELTKKELGCLSNLLEDRMDVLNKDKAYFKFVKDLRLKLLYELERSEKGDIKEVEKEKTLLYTALIVRVTNGYIVHENESEYRTNDMSVKNRQVFESKSSLFEYLTHNI
ncbi:MAG: hypothetical protein QXI16_03685 [Sulfolobaceae archaeon]